MSIEMKQRSYFKKADFKERNKKCNSFFRLGKADNRTKELSKPQVESIIARHEIIMTSYNYCDF